MNMNQFTQKSLAAIQGAQDIAVEHGNQQIEQPHLLLALTGDNQGFIPQLLTAMGSTVPSLEAAVKAEVEKLPKVSGAGREAGKVYVSQDVDKALQAAEREARAMKDEYISVEHILLGLLAHPNSALKELFRTYGLTKEGVLQALAAVRELLGEGKLPNVPDNQAHYYMGIASRMLGDENRAAEYFVLAASGPQEPERVLYYNDQPSDFIFYQGLANEELGRSGAAKKAYHQLTIFGEKHLFDEVSYDFFAVSLPEIEVYQDDITLRNIQYCNYLRALGAIGLGEKEKAKELLEEILKKQADHQGALSHREMTR